MSVGTQREEEIFDTARRQADAAARQSYLERACAGDPALRQRIDELLEVERAAERFFAETGPAFDLAETTVPSTRTRSTLGGVSGATVPGEEPLGTRIGRYKLVEKIGEGGWGVVYLAEQEEPVLRRVALKIIKLGMETKSVVARFEAERQALAMMDHPHIARVFDAGATGRGPPYFVMELVRGVRITKFCRQHRLGTRERLDLFVHVCHAIQHAHQKGIIHGDIKPSNIMVSMLDGAPVPKVIDFGIARATEARLTDRLLFTSYVQLIGTPAYMSPEQAELSGVDMDTRSDIYSLGVLLYELLTDRTPFDADELLRSGLDEMRRTLREKEPPRPSARLAALPPADLQQAAAERRTEPHRLVGDVRGDLDWIVTKALEKDRGRRYETANGLAQDVLRHLGNEPVTARPPSRLYRFRKLVRRNRVVFAAGGAVAAALIIGLATSTWLFLKEREAHRRALVAEQQQARLRHKAELREKVTQAALQVSQGRYREADGLLSKMVLNQPTLEGAAVFRAVGEWHALGERWAQAAERFARLLEIDQLDGPDVATLDCLELGPVLIEEGDPDAYEQFRHQIINRFAGAPGPFSDRIVKISLLRPADDKLFEALRPLAAGNERGFAEADQAGDAFTAAWRAMSLGLWEYRRGNFLKAAEWCRRCLACPDSNAPRITTARVILAMALQRQGRAAEARSELAAARDKVESTAQIRAGRGTPVQGFWFDWDFAVILLREATALNAAAGGS